MTARDALYVRYQVTDLGRLEAFLVDFGMTVVGREGGLLRLRGDGGAPFVYEARRGDEDRFLGAGFAVDTAADLERLAALPGSGPLRPTGFGGWCVRMVMPDGFEIDAVHGDVPAAPLPGRDAFELNTARRKARRNAAVRVAAGAAPVHRLGHVVLRVSDHAAAVAWFAERLGLIASDHLAPPDAPERIVGTFLRLDRGSDWVDHHCLLVLQAEVPGVHHCSFEVEDIDAVMSAHDHLLARGHRLDCGVGRHLLGSQVFDYWRDPFGFRIEHYADGDVVNHAHRATVFAGHADDTTQWGARPPREFFT